MTTWQGPILFCGDPHGSFEHIRKCVREHNPSAVILLGDIEASTPLQNEFESMTDRIYYIHGNHDSARTDLCDNLWGSSLVGHALHGCVLTLPSGVRVAGLGGVFDKDVWLPQLFAEPRFRSRAEHARATPREERWRGGVARKHWSTIYPEEVDWLATCTADILVTHEAPSGAHPLGFEILDVLAQTLEVKIAVHGHHHDSVDSRVNWAKQGFKSFGVGLRSVVAIDLEGNSQILVQGEQDEARRHRQRAFDAMNQSQ